MLQRHFPLVLLLNVVTYVEHHVLDYDQLLSKKSFIAWALILMATFNFLGPADRKILQGIKR